MKKNLKNLIIITASVLFVFVGVTTTNAQNSVSFWSTWGKNPQNTGQSNQDTSHLNGSVDWSLDLGKESYKRPTVGSDGTIYVGVGADSFWAISPEGEEKWRFDISGRAFFSGVGPDGTVYFTNNRGMLYALDENGNEKWVFDSGNSDSRHMAPVIIDDGTIYITSYETGTKIAERSLYLKESSLQAVNPDGTERWSFTTTDREESMTKPAIGSDGTIYVTAFPEHLGSPEKGSLIAINPDGAERWSFNADGEMGPGSYPTVGLNDTIYLTDRENNIVWAVNPDGTKKWATSLADGIYTLSSPTIASDGTIYLTSESLVSHGALHALNSQGVEKWSFEVEETNASVPAIGSEGNIYFTSNVKYGDDRRTNLYAVNPDGTERWSILVDTDVNSVPPVIGLDGALYVVAGDMGNKGSIKAIGGNGLPVTVGDTTVPLAEQDGSPWLWIVLGAVIVIVVIFVIKRKKQ